MYNRRLSYISNASSLCLRARSPASILLSCPVLAYQSIIGTKLDVTKISTAALQRFASSFALHLNSATHFNDVPARQVSLAFVLASANGVGFAFPIVRTSHTLMTPSDEAEAIRLESSDPSFRV